MKMTSIEANDNEWLDACKSDEYSTFFHSPHWYNIWNKIYGFKSETLKFELENKVIYLPLASKTNKLNIKTYFSSPGTTYGGFISEFDLNQDEKKLLFEQLKLFKNIVYRQNPFNNIIVPAELKLKADFTQFINLNDEHSIIIKSWSKGHKSAAKKALREGVEIKSANTWDEWSKYYLVYKDSIQRWGEKVTTIYSETFFKLIFEMIPSEYRTLWVAKYQGEVISGALCFIFNQHISYWHGATHRDFFKLRPSNALIYVIVQEMCNKQYMWFDMNPSGGLDGVIHFKNGFNCERKDSHIYLNQSYLTKSIDLAKKIIHK